MTTTTHEQKQLSGAKSAGALALLVILSASFMDLLDATIVVVAAPAIAADLQASQSHIQWMLAAYTLALGSGLITGGRIGDTHGRRRVFLLSLSGFALASALCALAQTPEMLIVTRALQGLAGGLMVPQVFGIIRSSFTGAGQAKAFGAFGAVQGLAAVAGPLLGGLFVEANLWGLGWRTIFWVNVPLALLALGFGARAVPESRSPHRASLDLVGAGLISASIVALLLPIVQGPGWGWPWWGWLLMAFGVLLAAVFFVVERRVARVGGQPILDPALLKVRSFSAGLFASLFFFGAIGAFFLTLSMYLQQGTGRSAWQTGLVMVPYAIGSILTSGVGVALVPKAGRLLLVMGALVLAVAQLWLWLLVRGGENPGYWQLAAPLFVAGLGLGLTAPILVNMVLAGVPGRDAGAAGGVLSTVNQLGGAIGIAALGTIFFSALGSQLGRQQDLMSAHSHALAEVLWPWQVGCYLLAAALLCLMPRAAQPEPAQPPA